MRQIVEQGNFQGIAVIKSEPKASVGDFKSNYSQPVHIGYDPLLELAPVIDESIKRNRAGNRYTL